MPLDQTLALRDHNRILLSQLAASWDALHGSTLDINDLDGSFNGFAGGAAVLIGSNRSLSIRAANQYLVSLGLDSMDATKAIGVLDREQFLASMHVTTIAAIKAAIARGETPKRAMAIGMSLSYGAAQRMVLDAQRELIMASAVAHGDVRGWRRIGVGANCDFCNMLIGRGGVYKAATAQFRSHDRCNCMAEPALDDSSPFIEEKLTPQLTADAVEATRPQGLAAFLQRIHFSEDWRKAERAVNPSWGKDGDEYRNNCMSCTLAYELRRQGWDVEAVRHLDIERLGFRNAIDMASAFRNPITGDLARIRTFKSSSSLRRLIGGWPDGARGAITVSWKTGGAHIFNVEKIGGKIQLVEAQHPAFRLKSIDELLDLIKGNGTVMRLDDLVPTEWAARGAVRPR